MKKTKKTTEGQLSIDKDWEVAIKEALSAPRPPDGWSKPEPVPQRAPKQPKTGPRNKKKAPE